MASCWGLKHLRRSFTGQCGSFLMLNLNKAVGGREEFTGQCGSFLMLNLNKAVGGREELGLGR